MPVTHAPIRPTFKATGPKAVWSPGIKSNSNNSSYIEYCEDKHYSNEKTNGLKLQLGPTSIAKSTTEEANLSPLSHDSVSFATRSPSVPLPELDETSPAATPPPSDIPPATSESPVQDSDEDAPLSHYINEKNIYIGSPDEVPPKEALLIDQKVTIEGDQVHTDTTYILPITQKSTKITTKPIEPTKYEGIGPTERGIPVGLRTGVKDEHASNWYKSMYKSLHIHDKNKYSLPTMSGYVSEPDLLDEKISIKPSHSHKPVLTTVGSSRRVFSPERSASVDLNLAIPPEERTVGEVYKNRPRPIENYEPGRSSLADKEAKLPGLRHLHPIKTPTVSYKDGYESDSSILRKKNDVSPTPDPELQKKWYQEVQRGGDIPAYGLNKVGPEKPKVLVVGPAPPLSKELQQQYNYYSPRYGSPEMKEETCQRQLFTKEFRGISEENKSNRISPKEVRQNLTNNNSPSLKPISSAARSTSPSQDKPLQTGKALFNFDAHTTRELSIYKGEIIVILKKVNDNWYQGKVRGQTGIFPTSYVELIGQEKKSNLKKLVIEGKARVKFNFEAKSTKELNLRKGDIVSLTKQIDKNWYEGKLGGLSGIFPTSYVDVLADYSSPRSSPALSVSPSNCSSTDVPSRYFQQSQKESVKFEEPKFTPPPEDYVPYRVLFPYLPQSSDELELNVGDEVLVIEKCDDGWYVGTSLTSGQFGTFPGNYVEII